ncbi:hypothetical protein ACFYWS_25265 [Streptomyces sp. NPDC002795]|uniref:hypothetical protein n=1 Tax=Streptomyces sp. NPDC002795 TaxID=3364665 RepID=UPI003698C97C
MRPTQATAAPTATTATTATGHRLALLLIALLSVLLTTAPPAPDTPDTPGIAAPPASASAPASAHASHPAHAAASASALDHHADDGCTPLCANQPRARHEQPSERTTPPPAHAPVTPYGAGLGPDAAAHRTAAPRPDAPRVSPGRSGHDGNRAPPVSSGT